MTKRKGFMGSAFDAMINARSRQANAYVNGALLMLDDVTLEEHGYSRKELSKKPVAYYPL